MSRFENICLILFKLFIRLKKERRRKCQRYFSRQNRGISFLWEGGVRAMQSRGVFLRWCHLYWTSLFIVLQVAQGVLKCSVNKKQVTKSRDPVMVCNLRLYGGFYLDCRFEVVSLYCWALLPLSLVPRMLKKFSKPHDICIYYHVSIPCRLMTCI